MDTHILNSATTDFRPIEELYIFLLTYSLPGLLSHQFIHSRRKLERSQIERYELQTFNLCSSGFNSQVLKELRKAGTSSVICN